MDKLNARLLPLLLVPILAGKIPPPTSEQKEIPKCKCGNKINKHNSSICKECFMKLRAKNKGLQHENQQT